METTNLINPKPLTVVENKEWNVLRQESENSKRLVVEEILLTEKESIEHMDRLAHKYFNHSIYRIKGTNFTKEARLNPEMSGRG